MFGLLFDEVDKDKNGSVTLEELKLTMQPSVSRHDIKHFVQVKKEVPLTLSFRIICNQSFKQMSSHSLTWVGLDSLI